MACNPSLESSRLTQEIILRSALWIGRGVGRLLAFWGLLLTEESNDWSSRSSLPLAPMGGAEGDSPARLQSVQNLGSETLGLLQLGTV